MGSRWAIRRSHDVRSLHCFNEPVYGGTGGRRLSAVVVAMSLLAAGTACRTDDSASRGTNGSGGGGTTDSDVPPADYETWEPSYADVRPATADDVAALRQRVLDLNETSYTVAVPPMGLEIASAPEHVRVRFAAGDPDGFDVHLDPTVAADAFFGGPFVMCWADGSCVDMGGDGADSEGPHMVNNGVDTIVFTSTSIVATQRALPDALDDAASETGSIATVDSPSGALDCLVTGGTPEQRAQLDGEPVDLMADPIHRVGDPEPLSTVCVDDHGLAVLTLPSLMAGVVHYGTFETGVEDGFDDHADPVPYGETASATPTLTTAPTSPGTDPDRTYAVLVAMAPIPAGESLADAQMSGRFALESVPGDEVVPGAVASTEGLDGVALDDIAEGEQITEDSFGSPAP